MNIGSLDHSAQVTDAWIDELDRRLGWSDRPRSYRLLKAVLCALGEQWPSEGLADLAAHFPVRLCGTNYEQWQTSTTSLRKCSARDFVGRAERWFRPDPIKDPSTAILAVFDLLSEKVSEDEIEDLSRLLPDELRMSWVSEHAPSTRSL